MTPAEWHARLRSLAKTHPPDPVWFEATDDDCPFDNVTEANSMSHSLPVVNDYASFGIPPGCILVSKTPDYEARPDGTYIITHHFELIPQNDDVVPDVVIEGTR